MKAIIGSLSNHDERDNDDVKYARRDWDENVAFGGKMKLLSFILPPKATFLKAVRMLKDDD